MRREPVQFAEVSLMDTAGFIVDNRGRSCPTVEHGIPLIATNCVVAGRRDVLPVNIRYVSQETYDNWFRAHPEPGDILFVCKGNAGRVAVVPDPVPYCIAQDMVAIRAKRGLVDPRYLYYRLASDDVQRSITNMHVGTLIPHFKKGDFKHLKFQIHADLGEQERIAAVLSALDDSIDQTRALVRQTQDLLQSLFRQWFVLFEPFGGVEPDGWGEGRLGDLLDLVRKPVKAGVASALPYVPIDTLPMRSLALERFRPNAEARSSLTLFERNDVLMGAMRVYFHRVAIAPTDGITRNTTFVLRAKDQDALPFALLLCNEPSTIDFASMTSKGSTMPYAVWDGALADMPVRIPAADILQSFARKAWPLLEFVRDSVFEVTSLTETRDELLPLLMSGRVRVAGVEGLVA